MISVEQIVLIGFLGVFVLFSCLLLMWFYSKPKQPTKKVKDEEKEREHIRLFHEMKNYLLTYLQCCYGAFIAIFLV